MQVVEAPEQLRQLGSQGEQEVPELNHPVAEQVATQALDELLRKFPPAQLRQVVAVPEQVRQFGLHGGHNKPDAYNPALQVRQAVALHDVHPGAQQNPPACSE